jgi:Bacteriocin-protection, YdeI or OmpD-Associated/Domain of unknown function (DUF1905)
MKFNAEINIIGVNPYVQVPDKILQNIFRKSGKKKGAIPIKGTVNGIPYKQTLVRYSGDWRLYINTTMLHHSPRRIGEIIKISAAYDPEPRVITPHPDFKKALSRNKEAKLVFDHLPPSRRFEIVRYLANLKTEKAIETNILRAINYLLGKERFVGRDKP